MNISSRLFCLARGIQSSLGVALVPRLAIVKTTQNVISGFHCNHRTIFVSAKLSKSIKVNSHGSLRSTLLVLDESEKEIGVMRMDQLKSLALEKNQKIICMDENAIPHPIYKLVTPKLQLDNKKLIKSKAKNLVLKPTISKNDLSIKIDSILDWLKKKYVVDIRLQINSNTEDKKHLEIYKEIMNTASSVAKISNSLTSAHSMNFRLELADNSMHSSSIPKPLTIDELKADRAQEALEMTESDIDKITPKRAKASKEKIDPVLKQKIEEATKLSESAEAEECLVKGKAKKAREAQAGKKAE